MNALTLVEFRFESSTQSDSWAKSGRHPNASEADFERQDALFVHRYPEGRSPALPVRAALKSIATCHCLPDSPARRTFLQDVTGDRKFQYALGLLQLLEQMIAEKNNAKKTNHKKWQQEGKKDGI